MDLHRAVVVVFFRIGQSLDRRFIHLYRSFFAYNISKTRARLFNGLRRPSLALHILFTLVAAARGPPRFSSGELRRLKESDQRQADRFVF